MRVLVILLCVLPEFVFGQYTYFNISQLPPHPEVGWGWCTNLVLYHDTIVTFTVSPNSNGIERNHYFISSSGVTLNEITYNMPSNASMFGQYSDAFHKVNGAYIFGTSFGSPNYSKFHGRIFKYDETFNELWFYTRNEFQSDSLDFSEYEAVTELEDQSIIGCGVSHIDSMFIQDFGSVVDTLYWPIHSNLFITKVSPNGELIWHKDLLYHNNFGFNPPAIFARICEVNHVSNGDILLWGGWYDQFDPFVIKLDSQGNFIDEVHWGNPTLGDWLAWPVQISDHEFMFAYSHAIGTSSIGQVQSNIQIGVLNSTTMTINSVHSYDHVYAWGGAVDFEATPDGGYVVLGYGGDPSIPTFMGEAYMMKIDANFNEEWFHAYHPPIPWYNSPNVYDLEIMPDGGMVFCGDFLVDTPPMGYTWFVKTDACGVLAYNGCDVGVHEQMEMDFTLAPNPAYDVLQVSTQKECVSTRIYDVTGKLVNQNATRSNSNFQINVADLTAGLYIIELQFQDGQTKVQRFVKE